MVAFPEERVVSGPRLDCGLPSDEKRCVISCGNNENTSTIVNCDIVYLVYNRSRWISYILRFVGLCKLTNDIYYVNRVRMERLKVVYSTNAVPDHLLLIFALVFFDADLFRILLTEPQLSIV